MAFASTDDDKWEEESARDATSQQIHLIGGLCRRLTTDHSVWGILSVQRFREGTFGTQIIWDYFGRAYVRATRFLTRPY